VVTDMMATPDLAALNETVIARQPSGKLMSSWVGRRLFFSYYMRILIFVTPRRALYWPTRDFAQSPAELDTKELRDVV
jgi:hypothetical protein